MDVDFNKKKDFQIANEITENINGISKIGEYTIKSVENHKFNDGFTIKSNLYRKLITINKEGKRIALLGFTINNRNIEIQSIQGINQKGIIHPTKWYQFLITPFIASILKVYQTSKRVSKYVNFPSISNGVIEGNIKEREKLILDLREKLKTERRKESKKVILSKIEYNHKKIKELKNTEILVKKIRDDYFTREGKINLKRKKIIDIIKRYKESLESLKNKKSFQRIKRLRKNTRFSKK